MGLLCDDSPRIGKMGNFHDLYRVNEGLPPGYILPSPEGDRALMVVGAGGAIVWSPGLQPWTQ
jgi:hypothetical protein